LARVLRSSLERVGAAPTAAKHFGLFGLLSTGATATPAEEASEDGDEDGEALLGKEEEMV
jgi:hypothetical protein